ncbi:MAG: hypothetical protein U1F43_39165 [Myxococcota bacterium]
MSAGELMRTAVRMLHDPSFLEAVLSTPEVALADVDLSDAERAMLAATDRRAWQVDPHRRWRVLTALVSEFPVAVAALRRRPSELDGFFRSTEFHAAIRARQSLFEAFPAWLARDVVPGRRRVHGMIALESTFARVRRAPTRPAAPGAPAERVVLAPWVASLGVAAGALDAWQLVVASLRPGGASDAAATVDALERGAVAAFPPMGPGLEYVLWPGPTPRRAPSSTAGFIDEALHRLLDDARQPIASARAARASRATGVDAADAEEILVDLAQDGLLVPVAPG